MAFLHSHGYASFDSGNPGSFTITTNFVPTPGDLICIAITMDAGAATGLTVKDSNNNAYTGTPQSPSTFVSGAGQTWLFYLLQAPANVTGIITAAWTSGANDIKIWVEQFSYTGTCFFDKDAAQDSLTNHTTINTPSITPANAGSLLYACAAAGGAITHPVAGATLGSWTGAAGGIQSGDQAEYDLNASSATAVDFTQTPTNTWSAMAMAFYTPSVLRELSLLGCGT